MLNIAIHEDTRDFLGWLLIMVALGAILTNLGLIGHRIVAKIVANYREMRRTKKTQAAL